MDDSSAVILNDSHDESEGSSTESEESKSSSFDDCHHEPLLPTEVDRQFCLWGQFVHALSCIFSLVQDLLRSSSIVFQQS